MICLNDLPGAIDTPSGFTVHGLGLGGGESVARKMLKVFDQRVDWLIFHRCGFGSVLKNVALRRVRSRGRLLCAAGPRDIFAILLCALMFRRADVFLQVPYHRALSWRDPLHFAAVIVYLALVTVLSRRVFVNSAGTGGAILFRRRVTVLPLLRQELIAARDLAVGAEGEGSFGIRVFNVVCRLNEERGRGSRDLDALIRFALELARRNRSNEIQFSIEHYGECSDTIRAILLRRAPGVFRFHGHIPDWVRRSRGPIVLFSRYEGFGLAAFEGAMAGRKVFVNEAFPPELIVAAPSILQFDSRAHGDCIFRQLYGS
jgi:glycosyltransferase involved in cell wall biosynthesis